MKLLLNFVLLLMASIAIQAKSPASALVFGGNGRLGAPIVRLLTEAGHPVTVFVRKTSDLSRLDGLDVDYVVGDLADAESVTAAIDGRPFALVIDATARRDFSELFYDTAMRNMLAALDNSGVQQFILHGSVGAGDNVNKFPDVPFGSMREMLVAKGVAEDLLRTSGIPYTIIRSGRIMRGEPPATGNGQLTEDDSVMASITRADLALLTMQCVENSACINKTFHAMDKSL